MAYLIGTDEAGYGPNLGPLVVTATLWEVRDDWLTGNIYEWLQHCVTDQQPDLADHRLWIGDSKVLYKPKGGLKWLETGVLAGLQPALQFPISAWSELLPSVLNDPGKAIEGQPWFHRFDPQLPLEAEAEDLQKRARQWTDGLTTAELRLLDVRSELVGPAEFNRLVVRLGNKSHALSHVTLRLIRLLLKNLECGRILIRCDKHGGRNKYAALLQDLTDALVQVRAEATAESRYVVEESSRRLEFRFTAKGDRHLPSAFASMISKYLRELSMLAFNGFWQRFVDELKPTAGYPVDARRFKREIAPAQKRLGLADEVLWRSR